MRSQFPLATISWSLVARRMLLNFRVRRLRALTASGNMNQFIFNRPRKARKKERRRSIFSGTDENTSSCRGKFVLKYEMNYRAVNLLIVASSNSSLLFPWALQRPKSFCERRPAGKELLRALVFFVCRSQSSLTFRVCRHCEMSNISFHTIHFAVRSFGWSVV